MITHSTPNRHTGTPATDMRRVLLFDDDPAIGERVRLICKHYGWTLSVAHNQGDTLLPAYGQRPKLVLLGFSLSDDDSLKLLYDLHGVDPDAPVGVITSEEPGDVAHVVGLAGGTAVVVKSCAAQDVVALM